MLSRERVITLLQHGQPDFIPLSLGGMAHKLSDSRILDALGTRYLLDDIPIENILAFFETAHTYGKSSV